MGLVVGELCLQRGASQPQPGDFNVTLSGHGALRMSKMSVTLRPSWNTVALTLSQKRGHRYTRGRPPAKTQTEPGVMMAEAAAQAALYKPRIQNPSDSWKLRGPVGPRHGAEEPAPQHRDCAPGERNTLPPQLRPLEPSRGTLVGLSPGGSG